MSIKRIFETTRNSGAFSDLCHGQKRAEIAIRRHTGFTVADLA